jgi:hypothetical protein
MDSVMEWEITVHKSFVEIVTRGIADKAGSLEMAKAITSTMKRNRLTRALIDHRSLETVTGEVIDIYERPRIFRIIGVLWGIRIAEVIKPDHQEHFKFLETVCINQGYRFSMFHQKDQALQWLQA